MRPLAQHPGAMPLAWLLLTLIVTLLAGCSEPDDLPSAPDLNQSSRIGHTERSLMALSDQLFAVDDRKLHPVSLLGRVGRKVQVPSRFRTADRIMYLLLEENQFSIDPKDEYVYVRPNSWLVLRLTKPADCLLLKHPTDFFDAVELNADTKNPSAVLKAMVSLRPTCLILNRLKLSVADLHTVEKMTSLQRLVINEIDLPEQFQLKSLPVSQLYVSQTQPESSVPSLLRSCSRATLLELRDVVLEENAAPVINKLVHLRTLALPGTGICDEQLQEILSHLNLIALNVHGTVITDAAMKYVSKQADLERLNVSRDEITDEGVAYLCKLKKLQNIDFANTEISDKGVRMLRACPHLKRLGLGNTKVSSAALPILGDMKLQSVSLDNDDISIEALRELKRRLPKIDID